MRIMQVNRPLYLQMLSFSLNDFLLYYKEPVNYILEVVDTITPTSLCKTYYDTIDAPHKTITVIPGDGHNSMYERPDECAAALHAIRETL